MGLYPGAILGSYHVLVFLRSSAHAAEVSVLGDLSVLCSGRSVEVVRLKASSSGSSVLLVWLFQSACVVTIYSSILGFLSSRLCCRLVLLWGSFSYSFFFAHCSELVVQRELRERVCLPFPLLVGLFLVGLSSSSLSLFSWVLSHPSLWGVLFWFWRHCWFGWSCRGHCHMSPFSLHLKQSPFFVFVGIPRPQAGLVGCHGVGTLA